MVRLLGSVYALHFSTIAMFSHTPIQLAGA